MKFSIRFISRTTGQFTAGWTGMDESQALAQWTRLKTFVDRPVYMIRDDGLVMREYHP